MSAKLAMGSWVGLHYHRVICVTIIFHAGRVTRVFFHAFVENDIIEENYRYRHFKIVQEPRKVRTIVQGINKDQEPEWSWLAHPLPIVEMQHQRAQRRRS